MTHFDEGQLVALRDDPASLPADALAHLDACPECRGALEGARARHAVVAGALESLDEPNWALEEARRRVRDRVASHTARAAGARSVTGRRSRLAAWSASRAAGLLLLTAAGLSALPGSPVRQWIGSWTSPAVESADAVAPATATPAPATPEEAGVRLPLAGGPLSVILRDAAPGTEIRVRWIPGMEAAVFAPVGSRFTSAEGRVEARDVSGVVRVELPRSVTPVSLEVNGRILLRNGPSGVDVSGPVVERNEAGVIFRLPTP